MTLVASWGNFFLLYNSQSSMLTKPFAVKDQFVCLVFVANPSKVPSCTIKILRCLHAPAMANCWKDF